MSGANFNIVERPAVNTAFSDIRKEGTTNYESWYGSAVNGSALSSISGTRNFLRGQIFLVNKPITLDRIAISMVTAGSASSTASIGIYNHDYATNQPSDLLLDAGSVSIDTTGVKSIVINQELEQGAYWLSINHNSTTNPSFRTFPLAATPSILGVNAALNDVRAFILKSTTYTVAMPDPFPTLSNSDFFGSTGQLIGIFVRLSS